jgi:hypothetical protein
MITPKNKEITSIKLGSTEVHCCGGGSPEPRTIGIQ